MSYTTFYEVATCTLPSSYASLEEVIDSTIDFIVNHADDDDNEEIEERIIPEIFLDAVDGRPEIEPYLAFDPETKHLTITCETDAVNGDSEAYSWLITYFAQCQASPYLKHRWCSFDSRGGADGGTRYWGVDGNEIDIDAALMYYLRDHQ
jgi:hypothetical protein